MSQQTKTQAERTDKHREENPAGEIIRKERQRQGENILYAHIRRNYISKIHGEEINIPGWIDQNSDVFKRVQSAYMAQVDAPVEVEELIK